MLRFEVVDVFASRPFTVDTELSFAGHPSVGTAHTLVRLGLLPAGTVDAGRAVSATVAGDVHPVSRGEVAVPA